MAGNPRTPKSGSVSKQTVPGSKGVFVGKNAGKGVVQSTAQKMKYGGKTKKKK